MKKYLVTGLAVALVLLSGCADKAKKKGASASSTTTSSTNLMHTDGSGKKVKTATTESTKKVTEPAKAATPAVKTDTAFWNSDKKVKLQQFMATQKTVMDVNFVEIPQGQSQAYFGDTQLPESFTSRSVPFSVDHESATMNWSTTGEGSGSYQLVAEYVQGPATMGDNPTSYLFTIKDGEPKVIEGSMGEYYKNQTFNFYTIENEVIAQKFASIVKSSDDTATAAVAATISAVPKIEGYPAAHVLAAALWLTKYPDEYEEQLFLYQRPAGYPIEPYSGSVAFPSATYFLIGVPSSHDGISFTDNGDGTVNIYNLPSYNSDSRLDDPASAKTYTQDILDNPDRFPLAVFSEEQLKVKLDMMFDAEN